MGGSGEWAAAAAVQYVLAGFALQMAVLFVLWWVRRPSDRHVLWLALWCLSLAPLLITSAMLFSDAGHGHEGALLLLRTLELSAITVLAIPAVYGICDLPVNRRLVVVLLVIYAVRTVLWVTTDAIYAHRLTSDRLPQYGALVGPFGLVTAVLVVGATLSVSRRTPDAFQRVALFLGTSGAAALTLVSWFVPARPGELLTGLWVTPLVFLLGLLGLHRVAMTESAEQRLVQRQTALADLGRAVLLLDSSAPVEAEAAQVLEHELAAERVTLSHEQANDITGVQLNEFRMRRGWRDGLRLQIERSTPLAPSEREFVDSVLQLVSASLDREAAENQLRRTALQDALTGLPNRTLLQDRLERGLAHVSREQRKLGVLFCGLDDFKRINDAEGHAAGDALIGLVGARLLAAARSADTVARFGGDEFVVVCESIGDPQGLLDVARRLRASVHGLEAPGVRAGQLSVSIGIASSDAASTASTLLRDAHTAMYRAKERGTGVEVFSDALRARLLRRSHVESGLARCLDRGEIEAHYQPVVDSGSLALTSVEALVRWRHDGALLLPGEWLDVAELSGQIVQIGHHVLSIACSDQARLGVPVAVNVSARQLAVPGFMTSVERALEVCGQGCLVLEITESAVIDDVEYARGMLQALRHLGVRVAMDDFGTGYSSLSALSRLPVDILKVDQSFVRRLDKEEGRAVVSTIVGLGAALGHTVIAEGVETSEQLEILRDLGCGHVQGFLTGRPVPLVQVPATNSSRSG